MGTQLINGVFFFPINPISTTGGSVMHIIKGLDKYLPDFRECYFSTADNKSPKAWKKHFKKICNLFVPAGEVKFVFYDDRPDSADFQKTVEFTASPANYGRLVINPGIWFGFSGLSEPSSIILNVTNMLHEPEESLRLEPGTPEIPYTWKFD